MRYLISNTTKRRHSIRSNGGISTLMPGASGPADGYEMPPSLARYYAGASLAIIPLGEAEQGSGKQVDLDALDAEGVRAIAEAEHVDLHDLNLADAADLATAKATVAEFRRIYESGTADAVRAEAEKIEGIDADALNAAATKYAVVNLIIAAQGVPGA